MQTIFKPAQTYTRISQGGKVREFGIVRAAFPGKVIMDVTNPARHIIGRETFNPAHNTGWRLCG